jgi:uncharacterized coiled-coil protein SlyX
MSNFPKPEYALARRLHQVGWWLRRVATRLFLAPLHAELAELRARQERLERQLHALTGRADDYGAVARRLAALEDRLGEQEDGGPSARDWPADPLPRKG